MAEAAETPAQNPPPLGEQAHKLSPTDFAKLVRNARIVLSEGFPRESLPAIPDQIFFLRMQKKS